ncbi:MAG: DUF3520 domain-containing protein [bacterium]|nr:DUF3520 domain-containing protein [bacterium]
MKLENVLSDDRAAASPREYEKKLSKPSASVMRSRRDSKDKFYAGEIAASPDTGYIEHNTEEYDKIRENEFKTVSNDPLSTFSIDVDTASYTNVRRFIRSSQLPPKGAVRIEEMINYFTYEYPQPTDGHPFSITTEIASCPWNSKNRLIHIGLQGKSLDFKNLNPSNLVFLIDSSGSMGSSNKLPLLKKSLKLLLNEMGSKDRIAIVAYAGSAGLILPSTPAREEDKILAALDRLSAGGSTAGGAGIKLAYAVAKKNLITGGNNRVILSTDGDFNIGTSSTSELVDLIEEKRKDDIFLTICGFGMGNYKDGRMEQISNAGNGNYFYIDSIREAKKVFVTEMRANMFTIAKDVKIQIEFNPTRIKAYRLVGYENRMLAKEDFNNDKKDAGELGAGHTVTALYEIVPAGSKQPAPLNSVDPLKYQETVLKAGAASSSEIMTVKLRYKPPRKNTSTLISMPVTDTDQTLGESSNNFKFSAAVAGFGMLLRDSQFKNDLSYKQVLALAKRSRGEDSNGYRSEFVSLVETCALLKR